MSDVAIGGCVLGTIGIEQIDVNASDLRCPQTGDHLPAGNAHADRDPFSARLACRLYRKVARIALAILRMLNAVAVHGLGEIALSVKQAYRNEAGVLIAGGLAVIARQHAQATGVDRKALVEAVLGAEIGYRAV